ncbi:MAG TPA: MarC family protein [bacterium]
MNEFWLCFVPLFAAVDAFGVLPLFIALTEGMDDERRRRVIMQSVVTAAIVAVAFLWAGPVLLRFLNISVPDFMIAGGVLLFAISLSDLLTGTKRQAEADPVSLGSVPIGVPLVTGPAVMTTCLLLATMYGRGITTAAVVVNIGLAGVVFLAAGPLAQVLGRNGMKTISKVTSLLLAAIGVMLIRRGLTAIL